jgi:hypothetical protein
VAEKLKVDKAFIALGIAAIPVFFLFFMGAGLFLVDVVGFVYPAYASIKVRVLWIIHAAFSSSRIM